jgi:hypothetical protein
VTELELTALHEAGHAALLSSIHELTGVVSIGDHGDGLTVRRHSLFFGTTLTRADRLRYSIAGCYVESVYTGVPVRELLEEQSGYDGMGDGDRVTEDLDGDSLEEWVWRTGCALDGYEDRVEDLASALLDWGTVDGRDAMRILRGSW